MKKYLFFIISLIVFATSYAQKKSGYGDSLVRCLDKMKDDTNKVSFLNDIADYYDRTNADKAIVYSDQALALADKLNWQSGAAEAYNMKGYAYQVKGDLTSCLDMHLNIDLG